VHSAFVRPFTAYWPASSVSFFPPLAWWSLGELGSASGRPYLPGAYLSLLVGHRLPAVGEGEAAWLAGEFFARALYTSVPAVFLWALWRAWRGAATRRIGELAALALAFVLSAFPRADYFHLISVYPVVLLLLAALAASRRPDPSRPPRSGLLAVVALLATTAGLAGLHLSQFSHRLDLDRASLRVSPFAAWVESVVRYAREEVAPHESLFVYGHEAYFYFLADRYSAWPFAQLYPGQDGGAGGRTLAAWLRRHPPALVVRGHPGVPSLRTTTPHLFRHVKGDFEPAPEVFERHPPRAGLSPPASLVLVLRPAAFAR
jgi:hypothetical protein